MTKTGKTEKQRQEAKTHVRQMQRQTNQSKSINKGKKYKGKGAKDATETAKA